jgi:hypothetical protein
MDDAMMKDGGRDAAAWYCRLDSPHLPGPIEVKWIKHASGDA